MTDTEIRDSLREVAAATEAPIVDAVAFQRLVRAERRHHRTRRVALVGASAAGLALVGTAAWQAVDTSSEPEPPGSSVATSPEIRTTGWAGGPVFFLQEGRLTALDPRGEVHDLGIRSQEVIGFTAEGVWAIDEDSHVVWFRVDHGDEGPQEGAYAFTRAPGPPGVDTAPVTGPVQRAELSGDGRYLAWTGLDDKVTTYDLKADEVSSELQTDPDTQLVDVGAAGLLLSRSGNLELRAGQTTIDLPDAADMADLASSLERTTVAVAGRDGSSRLYEVFGGAAELANTVPGSGDVAPDGLALATIRRNEQDGASLTLWKQPGARSLSGLVGTPESLAWADERMLLVVTRSQQDSVLYGCDVVSEACSPLYAGADLRLPTHGS